MASAKFLEEALSTDVDESAVNAIVGTLQDQLVTSSPSVSNQQTVSGVVHQNHVNSAISNGGTVSQQKHGVSNGESIIVNDSIKSISTNALQTSLPSNVAQTVVTSMSGGATNIHDTFNNKVSTNVTLPNMSKTNESIKLVYSQPQQSAIINNRVSYPQQTLANGTIGLSSLNQQSVLQTSVGNVQNKQPALVIKTTAASGATGLVTVPMNVTSSVGNSMPVTSMPGVVALTKQMNSTGAGQQVMVATPGTQTVQIVNMRQGAPTQVQQKNVGSRVLFGGQFIGPRPTTPMLQQGHLLLKTENGQLQLVRVGQATALPQVSTPLQTQQPTYRFPSLSAHLTTVAVTSVSTSTTTTQQSAVSTNPTVTSSQMSTGNAPIVTQTLPKHSLDNTKEKCRKFLANLLELSSREPRNVERNVRTLIQELIDARVEPEEFCNRLERLLNASPQPCLIGFLKKSLPLLRQALASHEMVIEGINPPPPHIVASIRPQGVQQTQQNVRVTGPTTIVRPGLQQPGLSVPVRAPCLLTTPINALRQAAPAGRTVVPVSQPPALHPVNRAALSTSTGQITLAVRPQIQQQARVSTPSQIRSPAPRTAISKPTVPSVSSMKPLGKDKEKKSAFSSVSYAPDDDINDVAAMGGVNLAEETLRILGSTEFVGTQIRSCKDELLLNAGALQSRLRQKASEHNLDEPSSDVTAIVSHATQELLKNIIEDLSVIAEHRIEIIKTDQRYEVQHDVRAQLKFLEELDRAERKRHVEQERELLLRVAKSRSKTEDPEQAKLKAKAKEMQRAEMEELRQREANLTALQAIGQRKKPRLDGDSAGNSSSQLMMGSNSSSSSGRPQIGLRPRLKRVNLRDLLFLLEEKKVTCKASKLYKAYLK